MHRKAISTAIANPAGLWPIYVDARSAAKGGLHTIIMDATPSDSRRFSLVVDGLDEVDREAAETIVRDARSMALRFPGSRITLFSRPGFVRWRDPVKIETLSESQVGQILEIVGGRRIFPSTFPAPLRSELNKPLFAILAARYFSLDRPRSVTPAGLLAILAEDVLAREVRPGVDVYQSLRRLACSTTEYGGPVPDSVAGPLEVRDALIATRLVVSRNRHLSFPNPTIEQYFAAQALLRGEVSIGRQLEYLPLWERWRLAWMLAVAVGGWEETRALIAPLLSANAGIASWLIGETVPKWGSWGSHDDDPLALPPPEVVRERIQASLELWRDALPIPFQLLAARYGYAWEALEVRLTVSGNMADISICETVPADGRTDSSSRLLWHRGISCSSHPAWPWRFVQIVIIDVIEDLLKSFMRSPDVPSLEAEQQYDLACSLIPGGFVEPLISGSGAWAAKVKAEAENLLEILDEHRADFIEVGRRRGYDRQQLETLANLSVDELARIIDGPYPAPDTHVLDLEGWSGYSMDQLALRMTEVYRSALAGYEEFVSKFFSDLRPMLGLSSLRPVEMVGQVRVSLGRAHVRQTILPLPTGSEDMVRISPAEEEGESDAYSYEALGEFQQRLRAYRTDFPSWTTVTFADGGTFTPLEPMPATKCAVRWIWRDLKKIHLTEQMAPR